MSLPITFQGKRIEYICEPFCKKGFGARPSSAIRFDLEELAQRLSASKHFAIRQVKGNYLVLEYGETIISIMRNGELLLEQVPGGDSREVEMMISVLFSDIEA
jgi:hypothetical protein